MAHMVPNIIQPIDRTYTLKYLKGNTSVKNDIDLDLNPTHYFILVYLPKNYEAPRYFILPSDELMLRREEYKNSVIHRGTYRDELGGINWSTAFKYENKWEILPE